MNKKQLTFLLVFIALVVVIVGSGILYQSLSKNNASSQLVVHNTVVADEPVKTEEVVNSPVETEEMAGEVLPAAESETAEEASSAEDSTVEEAVSTIPDVTLYDGEGNAVMLSSFIGKPLVINFWATWCGYCVMEMPAFQKAYESLGDEVTFLMMNMTDGQRETVEKAKSFLEKNAYTFPVLYDTSQEAAYTYGVYSLPMTLFVSADGVPVAYANGAISEDLLYKGLEMIGVNKTE